MCVFLGGRATESAHAARPVAFVSSGSLIDFRAAAAVAARASVGAAAPSSSSGMIRWVYSVDVALGPVPRVVVKVLPGARWRRGGLGVFRGAGSPVFSFLSRRQHRLSLAPPFCLGQTLCCLRGGIFR